MLHRPGTPGGEVDQHHLVTHICGSGACPFGRPPSGGARQSLPIVAARTRLRARYYAELPPELGRRLPPFPARRGDDRASPSSRRRCRHQCPILRRPRPPWVRLCRIFRPARVSSHDDVRHSERHGDGHSRLSRLVACTFSGKCDAPLSMSAAMTAEGQTDFATLRFGPQVVTRYVRQISFQPRIKQGCPFRFAISASAASIRSIRSRMTRG